MHKNISKPKPNIYRDETSGMDFGGTPFSFFFVGMWVPLKVHNRPKGLVCSWGRDPMLFFYFCYFFTFVTRLKGPGINLEGDHTLFFFIILAWGSPSRPSEQKSQHKSDHHPFKSMDLKSD